jgi:hypothetical protein
LLNQRGKKDQQYEQDSENPLPGVFHFFISL